MTKLRYAFAAAAAASLIAGVAVAQTSPSMSTDPQTSPSSSDQPSQMPADQSSQPAAPATGSTDMSGSTANSAANAGANASVTTNASGTQVEASPPVPDTPANRAKYGKPMSRAGKRTPATGD